MHQLTSIILRSLDFWFVKIRTPTFVGVIGPAGELIFDTFAVFIKISAAIARCHQQPVIRLFQKFGESGHGLLSRHGGKDIRRLQFQNFGELENVGEQDTLASDFDIGDRAAR